MVAIAERLVELLVALANGGGGIDVERRAVALRELAEGDGVGEEFARRG